MHATSMKEAFMRLFNQPPQPVHLTAMPADTLTLPQLAAPAPSCNVEMNQGQGNTLSELLFTMLNTMLKAYLRGAHSVSI
jgi:hypothetical protein